jgi:hypothetical protein
MATEEKTETVVVEEKTETVVVEEKTETVVVEEKASGLERLNWTKLAIRNSHGAIDVDATLAYVGEALAEAVGNEVDLEEIKGAVDGVIAKLLALPSGKTALMGKMDLAEVATRAARTLDAPFGGESMLIERVKEFIRGESDRFVESNGEEGSVHVKRGKDGGVRAATTAYVAEYRALQAKKLAAAEASK